MEFLSTLSLRRATLHGKKLDKAEQISIHALLAESDIPFCGCQTALSYFYPRSPCGERRACSKYARYGWVFLSTLSLRRATAAADLLAIDTGAFLSTLSLRRATRVAVLQHGVQQHFYPRSPCGERRSTPPCKRFPYNFYPRSPCGERPKSVTETVTANVFLSTLSLRRATWPPRKP